MCQNWHIVETISTRHGTLWYANFGQNWQKQHSWFYRVTDVPFLSKMECSFWPKFNQQQNGHHWNAPFMLIAMVQTLGNLLTCTSIHLHYRNETHGYSQCMCSSSKIDTCRCPPEHNHGWESCAHASSNNLHRGAVTFHNTTCTTKILIAYQIVLLSRFS